MLIVPSEGGAFVGLKNTEAAWAAPARKMASTFSARALAGFVGTGCSLKWEEPDSGFIGFGGNAAFTFGGIQAVGSSVGQQSR